MHMKSWWKKFVGSMNENGIPIPLFRYKSEGNPAFTLLCISTILIVVGIVGKWAGKLGGIDMGMAMQFFTTSVALFFGHSWVHKETKDAKGNTQELDLKVDDPDNKS